MIQDRSEYPTPLEARMHGAIQPMQVSFPHWERPGVKWEGGGIGAHAGATGAVSGSANSRYRTSGATSDRGHGRETWITLAQFLELSGHRFKQRP